MNDAPSAGAASLSTAEDTAGQVALTGSDVDGDTLTYSIASQPAHGAASAQGSRVTYTPAPNYSGTDSFAYVVSDGKGGSAGAVVSIDVSPVNDAPTAAGQSASTSEDTAKALRLGGDDADGDSLTYEVLAQPSRGTLSGSGAERTYTPAADYSGPDWFTYVVSDGSLRSSVAIVLLSVDPVNDAPTCADTSLTTDEDAAVESSAVCTDVDGDALAYSIVQAPSKGTASFVGGKLRYVPDRDVHGADSLAYRVSDATLSSNVATATLTVNSVNDAPVATSVAASLDEDGATDVALSGTDAEGDALSYEIVAVPAHGALTGTGPSRTYTPAANFSGSDSFIYRVSDGVATSGAATVTLSVQGVNDAPTCAPVVLATDEDAAAERDPDCVDGDGDALTYSIVRGATKGTASVAAGRLRYVPDANANGADGFTYRAADGSTTSAAAAVSVTVAAVNDAPAAESAALTASEDEEKALTLAASDLEGDLLAYEIVSGPEHGTLTGTGAERTYTPAPNYHGSDALTFRARDGALDSSVATVSITVHPVNDAPACPAQAMSLDEDASGAIEPACTDPDGDALTLEIVDQSVKGSASIAAGKLRYVANANANGADSFTYRAGDGTVSSAVATVSVTIAPVNDAPACADQTLATDEDVAAQLEPACTDIEGDALTYVVGGAAKGIAAIVAGRLRYAPNADLNGSDSFTYRASDGGADSNVATVAVTVAAVNDAPTATGQAATTAEDTEIPLTLHADDVDGDPLTYEIVSGPDHGTLSGEGASRTYTPAANFHGPDSFAYRVNDGTAQSGMVTVSVTVTSVNDLPLALGDFYEMPVGGKLQVAAPGMLANDSDVEQATLRALIVDGPAQGSVVFNADGSFAYEPARTFQGRDWFTYMADDGTAPSGVVRVTIDVGAVVNGPPVASDVSELTAEDTAKALVLAAADPDGDELAYSITSGPAHGTLSGSGANRTYTPEPNYHGSDSFTFEVRDHWSQSSVATVTLTVEAVNDAPVAADAAAVTAEDTAKELALEAHDIDGDTLVYTIVSGPDHGTLSGDGAGRTYTPAANYHGPDAFTYLVSDGSASSNVATASLTVTPVEDVPVAGGLVVTTSEDVATELVLPAADGDGDALTFSIVSGPAHATLSGSGANRTYTPEPNYHGPDSFTYMVDDGKAQSEVATVSVVVHSVNDAPTSASQEATTPEDTPKALTLSGVDLEGDPLTYTIVSGPDHGSLSGDAAERTYTPAANYNGPDSFTYRVSDGSADSEVATVTLTVEAVNDVPVAADLAVATSEDVATAIVLSATDVETAALAFAIVDGPQHGELSGTGADRTYTPAPNYHGPDSFTYVADDGRAQSGVATVSVIVDSVNDAPSSAPQEATTLEDTPKALTLSGVDVDGDALSYEIVTPPANGALSGSGADRTYTPAEHFHGPDSFTYKVSDGVEESQVATVTLTVEAVNDAPTANDQAVATAEDTAKALTLDVGDVDGDPLAFEIVSGPAHGDLAGTGPDRTYTPHPDSYGADNFSYTVSDGAASSRVATVSLTVAEVNDSPTAAADMQETAEDTELVVSAATLLANDGTGPPNEASQSLKLTAVGAAVGGTVAYDAALGEVRFAPDRDFHGTASFTYAIEDDGQTDGAADPKAAEGTVTVNVSSVNDAPVAAPAERATNEDEPVTFALSASDVDGDALQLTIEVQPLHGEVTALVGDQVTYTPAPNYWGPDTFTFVASDGSSSSSGVISIDVASVNDAPALDSRGTPRLTPVKQDAGEPAGDTVAEILASGAVGGQVITDVDGDPSGIAVVAADGSGGTWEYRTVGGSWASLPGVDASAARLLDLDSKLRFVPVVGFSGEATIRFRAWDRTVGVVGGTADATATGGSSPFSSDFEEAAITVIPNVPPVAVDDTASTTEDNEVRVDVLANDSDADGEPLTVAVETQPGAGTATVVDGVVLYSPYADRNGTDRFTYSVRDPRGGVATGTVVVTVTAVNDPPITRDDSEMVAEDGVVVFDPTGNDTAGPLEESGGALTLRTITAPAQHGAAAVTGGTIRYTPTPGFAGSDLLAYEVCDDATPALCSEANVTLTVSRVAATVETDPVPHAPQHNPDGTVKIVDAADDPAIWVNQADPAQSLIIGTTKFSDTTNGGLLVYDLDGNQLSYTNDGTKNNVDLRSGFPLQGREVALVTASQRNDPPQPKRVAIYTLDPSTKSLTLAGEFTPQFEPLGDCMYRSAKTGHFYVFVVSANGYVQQWRLAEAPGGTIGATEVRLFRVSAIGSPDIAEGCVADDELGHLYVSEEDVGVWKYSAEPDGGETRTQVDVIGGGQLTADVEGLTIAYGPGDTGYLIASSQGSSSFAVYRREGDNAFVRSFKIKDGAVDGTTLMDGIDVTTTALGPAFPNGMFVAQDNNNVPDNQNFKLVPLEQIVPTATLGSSGALANQQGAEHLAAVTGPLTPDPTQSAFAVYAVTRRSRRAKR